MKRILALGLLLVSTAAHADSKAWAAAKKVIPANMEMVLGVNAATAHTSALYQTLLPMALAKAGDAATELDGIKADCGIDVVSSIDSVVVGLDSQQKGTIVVAFRGTTRGKLEACAQKRAKAQQKTLTITNAGPLTSYSGVNGHEIFLRWLGADVVALATTPDDKDATMAATAGGVAGDPALHGLRTVNTSASLWAVSTKQSDLPSDIPGKMTGAFGSANLVSGAIAIDLHVAVDSPKTASDAVTKAQSQLGQAQGQGALADLLKTVKVSAAGNEILVTAQIPEKALLGLLAMFGMQN
jgi:hypothetical protein